MLVTFDSCVGRFTMLANEAEKLLRLMGHSGTVPSAILARDIPDALARLRAGLAAAKDSSAQDERGEEKDDEENRVSLPQRAFPLVDLLERAVKKGCDVTWAEAAGEPYR